MDEFRIPLEIFLLGGLLAVGAFMDRRDRRYAAEWQRLLDVTHHGTPLKPYDWELED